MKKLLLAFCLTILLLAMFLPLAAQEANPDFLPPTEEPAIETAAAALTNHVFMPLLSADGQPRNFVPDSVVAAAASGAAMFGSTFDRTRVPIELQDWWLPSYGHTHIACPVPIGLQVSGVVTLNCRVVMHDNPGKLHRVSITDENATVMAVILPGDLTCNQSVCAWAFDLKMDTTKVKNGWRELRIKTYVNTPDKKQMINSSGVPVKVKNGNGADSNFSAPCNGTQLIGRGWYDGVLYVNSIFDCIPVAPVSGIFTIRARAQAGESARLLVELDKSHFIPAVGIWPQADDTAGTILFDKAGNFQKFQTITIDTTKLANGWHSLSAKSFSAQSGMTNAVKNNEVGVAKIWFRVEN